MPKFTIRLIVKHKSGVVPKFTIGLIIKHKICCLILIHTSWDNIFYIPVGIISLSEIVSI